MVEFGSTHCSDKAAKNATFGTLDMLLGQEVDVIFGLVCSQGMIRCQSLFTPTTVSIHNKQR